MTRTIDLAGRVVLVAGAGGGMGRAIALAAAEAGARLCLFARSSEAVWELEQQIVDGGGRATGVTGDATDVEAAARAVAHARDRYGRLDVLVNAVGTNVRNRKLTAMTLDTWHELVAANLDAAYVLTQAVLPTLREQGDGLIIQISSSAARRPDASGAGYQATKAGVAALAHATMAEERENGIRVTVLYPGLTDTPLLEKRPVPPTPEQLARALQPSDIAHVCLAVMALPPRAHVPELLIYPSR